MNVLFLSASPRQGGFTARTMREIQDSLREEHTCEWIDVNNLRIKPCQACLRCRPDGECVLPEDEGHRVARAIRRADALVMGSPTYFGNITGPLRTLIDRSLTAFESIAASGLEMPVPLHVGRKAAIVTACNMPAPGSELHNHGAGALFAMETTIKAAGYELVGKILIDGAAARVELPEEIKTAAQLIANRLVI